MLKRAYRVTGRKDQDELFLKVANNQLINYLYNMDECFKYYRDALYFAKRETHWLNDVYELNLKMEDYFYDLKEDADAGFRYNTETDDFEWEE